MANLYPFPKSKTAVCSNIGKFKEVFKLFSSFTVLELYTVVLAGDPFNGSECVWKEQQISVMG